MQAVAFRAIGLHGEIKRVRGFILPSTCSVHPNTYEALASTSRSQPRLQPISKSVQNVCLCARIRTWHERESARYGRLNSRAHAVLDCQHACLELFALSACVDRVASGGTAPACLAKLRYGSADSYACLHRHITRQVLLQYQTLAAHSRHRQPRSRVRVESDGVARPQDQR